MEKRVIENEEKKGVELRDLLLTAVLLAAGAVLKFFVSFYRNGLTRCYFRIKLFL